MSRYHRNTKREGEKSTRKRDDRLESLDRITAPTEGCSKREQRNANGRISSVAFRVLKARLYRSTLSSLCLFSFSLFLSLSLSPPSSLSLYLSLVLALETAGRSSSRKRSRERLGRRRKRTDLDRL